MVFLDASALAKVYLDEPGTGSMRGVLDRCGDTLFVSDFVVLEVLTSIRNALRTVPATRYNSVLDCFQTDYQRFSLVDVAPEIRKTAIEMTSAFRTARARSMDVLHVATALWLQRKIALPGESVTVGTSDRDLAVLAEGCGLRTFDPSREPLATLPRARRG